ncbi:hypothetical protein SaccyDRAFT_4161 [Saccharomonospora cyanea NA-134]|uniref:Uncharacterized protein n=1 Tax=Saccharomonospora cyanea NA-134 TaxID=882082 RepID=H5XK27_9PSEU|nr:hypothetical protein SaccyDRAFT_4161 [Saccharomonospora cyanea NA-134]
MLWIPRRRHWISGLYESVLIPLSRTCHPARPRLGLVKRPLAIVSTLLVVGGTLAVVLLFTRSEPPPPLPEPITVSTPSVPPGSGASSPTPSPTQSRNDDDDGDVEDDDADDDDGMVAPPPALDDVDDRDDFDDDDDDVDDD